MRGWLPERSSSRLSPTGRIAVMPVGGLKGVTWICEVCGPSIPANGGMRRFHRQCRRLRHKVKYVPTERRSMWGRLSSAIGARLGRPTPVSPIPSGSR